MPGHPFAAQSLVRTPNDSFHHPTDHYRLPFKEPLIERLELHQQATCLHTSGISQAIVAALFDHWRDEGKQKGCGSKKEGEEAWAGFESHVYSVNCFYGAQRNAILSSARKHLAGLAEWTEPTAGMFLWLKLLGVDDTMALIRERAVEQNVLFVPGSSFEPVEGESGGAEGVVRPASRYIRASFSTSSPEEMDEALARLASLIRSN